MREAVARERHGDILAHTHIHNPIGAEVLNDLIPR